MKNNDVIQSIRYMLDISDAEIANILKLADYNPSRKEIEMIFEEDDGTKVDATHELTAHFLDGLIYHKRGKSDKHPPRPIEIPVTNNQVLKKLRVAFKLKEEDVLKLMQAPGFRITQSELNAFFRKKSHKNYMLCGDQALRYFLKGLTMKLRG
jgi:uncharacterized protein YehS (DUF1456 family)